MVTSTLTSHAGRWMVDRAQRDAVRLLRYQPEALFWLAISQIYPLGVRGLALGIATMTSWGFDASGSHLPATG
jgi:hypothetical protein